MVRISCTSYRSQLAAQIGIAVTESQVSFSGCFKLFQSASSCSKDLNMFNQHGFTVVEQVNFGEKVTFEYSFPLRLLQETLGGSLHVNAVGIPVRT